MAVIELRRVAAFDRFIRELRLSQAREALEQPGVTVAEAALSCRMQQPG